MAPPKQQPKTSGFGSKILAKISKSLAQADATRVKQSQAAAQRLNAVTLPHMIGGNTSATPLRGYTEMYVDALQRQNQERATDEKSALAASASDPFWVRGKTKEEWRPMSPPGFFK